MGSKEVQKLQLARMAHMEVRPMIITSKPSTTIPEPYTSKLQLLNPKAQTLKFKP